MFLRNPLSYPDSADQVGEDREADVKAAVMAANGEKVPELIDTGFYYYDKSNIDSPEVAAVLYD